MFCLAIGLSACSTSNDEPESDGPTAVDEAAGNAAAERPTGTPVVHESCPDDVISALRDLAGGAKVYDLPPTETDPDLTCSFFGGDDIGQGVGVIFSASKPPDWSQLGEVETSDLTVAGFDAKLANLIGAGQALVVDLEGVYVTINVGKDADVTADDVTALADVAVRSAFE